MARILFPLGICVITRPALRTCQWFPMPPDVLLLRHATGDWSDMTVEDQWANHAAVQDGTRILSAYQYGDARFYVITEADRSKTTILLAEEY